MPGKGAVVTYAVIHQLETIAKAKLDCLMGMLRFLSVDGYWDQVIWLSCGDYIQKVGEVMCLHRNIS